MAAALQVSAKRLALVVPAVPAGPHHARREVWIHQQRLIDTEFASDPKTPVTSSNVLTRLQMQCDLPGEQIDLATVRSGTLAARLATSQGLLVLDAEQQADIDAIIAAAATLPERPLLVGASGLSDALGAHLAARPLARCWR